VRQPLKSPQCYTGFSRDYASARSRPLIFSLQYPQIWLQKRLWPADLLSRAKPGIYG